MSIPFEFFRRAVHYKFQNEIKKKKWKVCFVLDPDLLAAPLR